jgi:hypothetical protein
VRLAAETAAALAEGGEALPASWRVGPADVADASSAAALFNQLLSTASSSSDLRALAAVLARAWGGGAVFGPDEAAVSTRAEGPLPILSSCYGTLLAALLAAGDGGAALAVADGGVRVAPALVASLAQSAASDDPCLGAALVVLLAPFGAASGDVASAAAALAGASLDASSPSAPALLAALLARAAWPAFAAAAGPGAGALLAAPRAGGWRACLAASAAAALASAGAARSAARLAIATTGLHPGLAAADGGVGALRGLLAAAAAAPPAATADAACCPVPASVEAVARALPFAARAALAGLGG